MAIETISRSMRSAQMPAVPRVRPELEVRSAGLGATIAYSDAVVLEISDDYRLRRPVEPVSTDAALSSQEPLREEEEEELSQLAFVSHEEVDTQRISADNHAFDEYLMQLSELEVRRALEQQQLTYIPQVPGLLIDIHA